MNARDESFRPRPLVPTSPVALLLWTLATGLGFSLLGSAGLPLHGFVPCALFQSALLFFWNRSLSWRWLLGSALLGVAGGLVAMIIALVGGMSGLLPDLVAVTLSGAVAGAGFGLGGALALKSMRYPAFGWVAISAVAWALGCGISRAIWLTLDPHGMEFFQQLTASGLSERTASFLVGSRSGIVAGLIAGAVSALWAATLLKRHDTTSGAPA